MQEPVLPLHNRNWGGDCPLRPHPHLPAPEEAQGWAGHPSIGPLFRCAFKAVDRIRSIRRVVGDPDPYVFGTFHKQAKKL